MHKCHKLLFVGDVVMNSEPRFSSDVSTLWNEAVIRSCNVEAPLRGFGEAISKTGPLINQDPRAADWLKNLGFNLFTMANNHIYDYGDQGLVATKAAFPSETVIGVGKEEEAYGLIVKEIEGIKYGFLAYAENGYGALNGEREQGYAWINHKRTNGDVASSKAKVDVLIVQIHAGVELLDVPIPEWRERFYELIDCGADIIVAHHPHILQGVEVYKDKMICYSLGNFWFDYPSTSSQWNIGGVLEVSVEDGVVKMCHLHVCERKNQQLSLWSNDESSNFVIHLNDKLKAPYYMKYVNSTAVDFWKKHHANYYAKAVNGLVDYSIVGVLKHIKRAVFKRKIDHNMMWHNLFVESNLWLVKRATQLLK